MKSEKDITSSDDYRFLGKEIEYDKLLFKYLSAIADTSIRGSDATNLVNLLESTFTYKDERYVSQMQKARDELERKLKKSRNSKYGRVDPAKQRQAITEFTMTKYNEICRLMKRKKKFPQEAEEEVYE